MSRIRRISSCSSAEWKIVVSQTQTKNRRSSGSQNTDNWERPRWTGLITPVISGCEHARGSIALLPCFSAILGFKRSATYSEVCPGRVPSSVECSGAQLSLWAPLGTKMIMVVKIKLGLIQIWKFRIPKWFVQPLCYEIWSKLSFLVTFLPWSPKYPTWPPHPSFEAQYDDWENPIWWEIWPPPQEWWPDSDDHILAKGFGCSFPKIAAW